MASATAVRFPDQNLIDAHLKNSELHRDPELMKYDLIAVTAKTFSQRTVNIDDIGQEVLQMLKGNVSNGRVMEWSSTQAANLKLGDEGLLSSWLESAQGRITAALIKMGNSPR